MCIAKWENNLGKKDIIAKRQREKERAKEDSMYSREVNKETRKARLEELYLNDELRYDEELNMRGLALRKQRY